MVSIKFFLVRISLVNNYCNAHHGCNCIARKEFQGCKLITNEDWSKNQALILNENMTAIVYPDFQDSIFLASTEKVVLACPGSRLALKPEKEAVASCHRGTQLEINEENYEFNAMSCEKLPETSTRTVGTCLEETVNGTNIEIGFNVEKNFIKLLDICFDYEQLSTVYSHYKGSPKIIGKQHGIPRRKFQEKGFYNDINVSRLYSRKVQRKTISNILGSEELGNKYIKNDSLYFLARGHLSAKSDFIYGSEQIGTFYYINVAPQWQIINGGNWLNLENSVRNQIIETGLDLSVYTLPYDVTVLPDINGTFQKLYLYHKEAQKYYDYDSDDYIYESDERNLVPVPKFFIKILYHEETMNSVAFVTVNNPYLKEITDDYILCEDVCSSYPWLTWDQTNIELGYSYCCSYETLKNIVTTLPNLPVEDLL